jgi:hypothetical protein
MFRRGPGVRLSKRDLVVLLLVAVVAYFLWPIMELGTALLLMVVGHFFLFCNVFRVPRKLELIWAAAFVLNVLGWRLGGSSSWEGVLAVQTPLTLLFILLAMQRQDYHGLGWKWINPQLDWEREKDRLDAER